MRRAATIVLVAIVGWAIYLFASHWFPWNPYANVKADDVKAVCLCKLNWKTNEVEFGWRIVERQCIEELVEAICRPRLQDVLFLTEAIPTQIVFLGKDEKPLLYVWYHYTELCVTFHRLWSSDGKLFDAGGWLREKAVVGNKCEEIIADYLRRNNLKRELFYGETIPMEEFLRSLKTEQQ